MNFDPARWLSELPDALPISEINIPGTHNSAAINTSKRTRWTCQDHSITGQLNRGIRLLDIRLKPKRLPQSTRHQAHQPTRDASAYTFTTCHGHLGLFGADEFQSLESVLDECTSFLKTNPAETIIAILKIDNSRQTPTSPHVLTDLQTRLSRHNPLLTENIPTLGQCRGKIFLINRINDNPELGTPIEIPDNTPGTTLTSNINRQYDVYVQDQYKNLDPRHREAHKLDLVIKAFGQKRPGNILLNFASGTKPFGRLLDIKKALSQYLAARKKATGNKAPNDQSLNAQAPFAQSPRESRLGYLLLDYPFTQNHRQIPTDDVSTIIISSNFPLTKTT